MPTCAVALFRYLRKSSAVRIERIADLKRQHNQIANEALIKKMLKRDHQTFAAADSSSSSSSSSSSAGSNAGSSSFDAGSFDDRAAKRVASAMA